MVLRAGATTTPDNQCEDDTATPPQPKPLNAKEKRRAKRAASPTVQSRKAKYELTKPASLPVPAASKGHPGKAPKRREIVLTLCNSGKGLNGVLRISATFEMTGAELRESVIDRVLGNGNDIYLFGDRKMLSYTCGSRSLTIESNETRTLEKLGISAAGRLSCHGPYI